MIVEGFHGPGGWAEGRRLLGITTRAVGMEWDAAACATAAAAGHTVIRCDVAAYPTAPFKGRIKGKVDSPPCQTFSVGGKGRGRNALDVVLGLADRLAGRRSIADELSALDDERTGLVLEPLRWALQAIDGGQPYRTVTLEQVPTVLPVWEKIAELLRREGYTVVTGRLSAEEHGVAQTRSRAVLAASLHGAARLPEPTHQRYRRGVPQGQGALDLKPWLSMADGIGWGMTHRPALTIAVGTAAGGPDPSCVGGSGARATLYGERDAGRWIACTRLIDAEKLPAYRGGRRDTIRLSVEDAAILQGFPADHPWRGSRTKQLEQIGNAFPPPLAEAVLAENLGRAQRLEVAS